MTEVKTQIKDLIPNDCPVDDPDIRPIIPTITSKRYMCKSAQLANPTCMECPFFIEKKLQ